MAQGQLQRPSVGQWADLGAFYDARTDTFVSHSLIPSGFPNVALVITPTPLRRSKLLGSDTYQAKFVDFGMGADLGASFLSGMIDVAGAAEYLKHHSTSHLSEQVSVSYTVATIEERLNLQATS